MYKPIYKHTLTHVQTYNTNCPNTHTLQIKTFSSLPNSYRNRAKIRGEGESDLQRARSKEELTSRQWPSTQDSPRMGHRDPRGGGVAHSGRSPRVSRDYGSSPHLGNSPHGSVDQGGSPHAPHWPKRTPIMVEDERSEFTIQNLRKLILNVR